ncbi:MAG: GIY-YIG nuclease family protein [Syntrophobacterales bacterium]|nr:GIY-YIG nuclease family protein [Syntrophobacterales bacterium]
MWYVYICDRRGQLYTGITTNLSHRMKQHSAELLYSEICENRHEAAGREREIGGKFRGHNTKFREFRGHNTKLLTICVNHNIIYLWHA